MAAVEVTISGVLYDKINRTQQAVVLIGDASLTGLGPGGGPIVPPQGGQPGVPTFPIWGPPGSNFPGGPGYPPVAGHPLPEPPQGPPGGGQPPDPPSADKPPPEGQPGWGWMASASRWGYFPGPGQAGPKA